MSRDAPPPKCIWDAEDDEFDRWPTAAEARKELDSIRQNATAKRGTFIRPVEPELDVAEKIAEAVRTPMGDATRSLSEEEQTILELEDMDCGNPGGRDLHDSIIMPLRSRDYTALPASAPTRHMHALDAKATTDQLCHDPPRGEQSHGRDLLQLRDHVSVGIPGALYDRQRRRLDRDVGFSMSGDDPHWQRRCAL